MIVLRGVVMFPKIAVPLFLNDTAALAALDAASKQGNLALFLARKSDEEKPPPEADLYRVGTVSKIVEMVKQPDGVVRLLIEGVERAKITGFTKQTPYWQAAIEAWSAPKLPKTEKAEAAMYSVVNQFKEVVNLGAPVPFDVLLVIMNITDPWQLGDLVALNLDLRVEEKQSVLEAETAEIKLERVGAALTRQMKVLRMAKKLQADTGKELGKMEREMFLREQLKAIEKELGMLGGKSETEELRTKIEAAGMPQAIKDTATKELSRLASMPSFSPEVSYIRTYLDWLVQLPWARKDESKIDIGSAERILNEDHYGLEKVKERILEYLAVQKLAGKMKGSILCFAGPPGTGKTSIGKSIARALGRKFVRISLGGVRDEAEIRGFRRTYVGALPGRILQGIATAGTKNPVFMLDEIDKIGADFRGDPSAALLEALDPEQNNAFSDHYLEVPFDLSEVMFITTANIMDTIPPALRDRMEVIEFPGYTEDEKLHIAKDYLIAKLLTNHGLKVEQIRVTDEAIREVIRSYTREAGVRNLEREIAHILRKFAKEVAAGSTAAIAVGPQDLAGYLGPAKFHSMAAEKKDEVGVVTGLAWTEAGGEIIIIEATSMPGSGKLILTGHLGQVMQESAQAAFSFARAYARDAGAKDTSKDTDVHVHVPGGAIPKDGPSAGVAMATALVSLLIKKPVKRSVAMTGEVTLRGRVLEIGGLKEKSLAAHRAGIRTLIVPQENEKDAPELPENIRKECTLLYAESMDDVLRQALV